MNNEYVTLESVLQPDFNVQSYAMHTPTELEMDVYYANQKKRRTSRIDDKTFPRNEKQKTKTPFESS